MIQIPVEAQYTEYIHNKAARLGIPLNGTFELTPCCNMACKMCYVRKTKAEQEAIGPLHTAKEWLALGEKLRDQGMLYLLLTGGEPFVHPQFREIMEGLHKMGLIISINSNATMIDEKVVEWLRKVPPVRINITLYGASDETYGRLCCNPHGFTQVTKAIRLLTEAGITVKINCSVTPSNVCDLAEIFQYCRDHHLIIQATSYMFPPVRRDESMIGQNFRFCPEEAAYHSARISCLLNGEDAYLERMKTDAPLSLAETADCPDLPDEGDGIRCRAGKCSFWVTWEGKLMACGMMPSSKAPNIFKTEFAPAWEQIKKETAAIRLPRECAGCALKDECRACAAMVYTETGSFSKVPEYRCKMEKAYAGACKRLEQEILDRRNAK